MKKIKQARVLLKTTPRWFINYIWNTAFKEGNTCGFNQGKEWEKKRASGDVKTFNVSVSARWCSNCRGNHLTIYMDDKYINKLFSDKADADSLNYQLDQTEKNYD